MLAVLYSSMGALDYEMDQSPDKHLLQQLQEMLLFAVAVGCSTIMIKKVAGLLHCCVMPQLVILLDEAPAALAKV